MMLHLFCRTGRFSGKEYRVEKEAIIGRGRQNEIDLALDFISPRHAKVYFDEGKDRYFIMDLGSGGGTAVDGNPIKSAKPLPDLCVISLSGQIDFICRSICEAPETSRQAVDRTILAPPSAAPPPGLGPDLEADSALRPEPGDDKTVFEDLPLALPKLPGSETEADSEPTPPAPSEVAAERDSGVQARYYLILHLADQRTEVELATGECLVGRQEGAAVVIPHPTVGRRQALFICGEGSLRLRDLGAANPTTVDGETISGREVELQVGSRVKFGAVACEVRVR